MLYLLKKWQDRGDISKSIPIYLDGTLAINYTQLYVNANIGIKKEMHSFLPKNLTFVSKEMRPALLDSDNCKIILTTSGMGSYGPAQVYIPAYINREDCLLQFTGYTAEGTLGRKLKDAQKGDIVTINGIVKQKLAEVEYTNELSAHAKADELIDFLRNFNRLNLVLVSHGETKKKIEYSTRVAKEIDPKNVAILEKDYFFRVNPYGLVKSLSMTFN